jgi:hypothetical protein
MTYEQTKRNERRVELDRQTWAGTTVLQTAYETEGSGQFISDEISFGTVFEGRPFFSHGVELVEGQTLVAGDYPFITAGVSEWVQEPDVETAAADPQKIVHYLGAYVWINVASSSSYLLRFRLSFEGTASRNVEMWRGSD